MQARKADWERQQAELKAQKVFPRFENSNINVHMYQGTAGAGRANGQGGLGDAAGGDSSAAGDVAKSFVIHGFSLLVLGSYEPWQTSSAQVVAEAMAEERERLQRENAGALEQAQVMGREVVHLEEQVLKLRSSELRLRKELEGTQSGYDSARRQLTTLAADRASLRQMMDALQEGESRRCQF